MDEKKIKFVSAVMLAAIMVIIFITAITVSADLYPPLKNWLKNIFTHHWIGKGVLSSVLFAIGALLFSMLPVRITEDKLVKKLNFLFWVTILGTIAIFTFFIYEAFLPKL